MERKTAAGHLAALITILVWGTTFISTKLLLVDFKPVEILFFRFVMGYVALILACPRMLRLKERRQELTFALAGLCGVCMYYLLENIALTYTLASNEGRGTAEAQLFRWIRGGYGRNLPDQLQRRGGLYLESGGRPAGPGRSPYLGLLFCADPQNQRLRLRHHPGHQEDFLLRAFVYGSHPVFV